MKSTLNIRIDEDLKKGVEEILDNIGLNHSSAVRLLYMYIKRYQGIPKELVKVYDEVKND